MNLSSGLCLVLICLTIHTTFGEDVLTPEQAKKLNPETGLFNIHNDEIISNKYKIEVKGKNGITIGCYGYKQEDGKWQSTNYVSNDLEGYRTITHLDEPITVVPDSGKSFTLIFSEILPQCGAFWSQGVKVFPDNPVRQPSASILVSKPRTSSAVPNQVSPPNTLTYASKAPTTIKASVPLTDRPIGIPPKAITPANPPRGQGETFGPTARPLSLTLPENRYQALEGTPFKASGPLQSVQSTTPQFAVGRTSGPSGGSPFSTPQFGAGQTSGSLGSVSSPKQQLGASHISGPFGSVLSPRPQLAVGASRISGPLGNVQSPRPQPVASRTSGSLASAQSPRPPFAVSKSPTSPPRPPITSPSYNLVAAESDSTPRYQAPPVNQPTGYPLKANPPAGPLLIENPCTPSDVPTSVLFGSPSSTHSNQLGSDEPFPISFDQCTCTCPNTKRIPKAVLQG